MERTKIEKYLFVIITAALLFLPGLTTNLKKAQVSEFDNRNLTEMPALRGENFRGNFEQYLGDRVGFREQLISSYQLMCGGLFHKLAHPHYLYGKDDWIFDRWDLRDYQHLDYSGEYVDKFGTWMESLQKLSEAYGASFLFYYAPNKESIYPEYFAPAYHVKDQPNRTDAVCDEFRSRGIHMIDGREVFLALKDSVDLYNQKYDAGHWNYHGAFYAHQAINAYFLEHFPQMGALEQDEFIISEVEEPYLQNSRYPIHEMTPDYRLAETAAKEDTKTYFEEIRANGKAKKHFVNPEGEGKPRILLMGDSYLHSYRAPHFYKNHCSELLVLHSTNNNINLPYYISVFRPDIVIYEAAERVIGRSAVPDDVVSRPFACAGAEGWIETPCTGEEMGNVEMPAENAGEYVQLEGTYKAADGRFPYMTGARVNGQEYYPIYNREDGSWHLTIRRGDLERGAGITFFRLDPETAP